MDGASSRDDAGWHPTPTTTTEKAAMIKQTLTALTLTALVAASPLAAQQKAAAKLDDPTIIAIFDAANTWDMETGALAEKKGTTKEVRDYGAMLARDHAAVRQM